MTELQVGKHLRSVDFSERFDCLDFDDHRVLHDEIELYAWGNSIPLYTTVSAF